jgi:vancomycin permeability regulator SanA
VVALAALAIVTAGAIVAFGLRARPGHADVAIVFGNTVSRDGTPSPRLAARLESARRVYAERRAPMLFVSGGIGREGHDESLVMRDWLVAHGVPDTSVVRDSLGLNSARTAEHARAWMVISGARDAIVVTQ